MASSSTFGADPTTTPNTTFVQADPSNFRAVVQKLTGASDDPSTHKLPLTLPSRLHHRPTTTTSATGTTTNTTTTPKRPLFKLHERRKKLEQLTIGSLSNSNNNIMMFNTMNMNMMNMNIISPSSSSSPYRKMVVVGAASSPVSPLDAAARGSPRSPQEEEEERAIAEKGFYLHPISPLATPRGSEPPELLPLFPLHSPNSSSHRENHNANSSS